MKPEEILLKYIQEEYNTELTDLVNEKKQNQLKIDYTHLNEHYNNITGKDFFQIKNYNRIINIVEKEINRKNNNKTWTTIKIIDVPPNCELHDLDATYNGNIISAKAMIKNITETTPGLKTAVYECRGCMRLHRVDVKENIVAEPTLCTECGGRSFRPVYDLSEFRNYRYAKLEEPLELRSGGSTREFKVYMEDYLASPHHNLKAGDVVDILGEFKVRKTDKKHKDDFEFLIDLHNITPVDNAFEDYRITESDKEEIRELSKDSQIFERLVNSLAPEIVGYTIVKQGLLLQLFEGYRPADDVFKSEVMDRWTIHVLLIGDPGIGKSQLVTALQARAPKLNYISGADTTRAGLTTAAVKDELTGAWTLEAGAVVLADTGVLCIDEFDKLPKSVQKTLNQPMEQLTVSSTKAGLMQTMSARTSVVACANPKYSKFNNYKSVKDQIDIPDSTLSRFDLVFKLEDTVEVEKDTMIATSLLNNNRGVDNNLKIIPTELFKKYITYAKLEVFPVLNDDAKQILVDFYVKTRQAVYSDESAKPITARDLKAIERLTIARAKAELREEATVDDVKCAISIYTKDLETLDLSPETAGELQQVMSNGQMKMVNDTEEMLLARMRHYSVSKVNDTILYDVRRELGVKCFETKYDADSILDIALQNVKKQIRKGKVLL